MHVVVQWFLDHVEDLGHLSHSGVREQLEDVAGTFYFHYPSRG